MKKTAQPSATPPSPATSFNFAELSKRWPAPVVARNQKTLDQFSGGLLNAKTLANLDSQGLGPEGKITLGRKVAYPVEALVVWMNSRLRAPSA